jgi:hypothetical protein
VNVKADVAKRNEDAAVVKREARSTDLSAVSPSRFVGQSLSLRVLPWMVIAVGVSTVVSNASRLAVGVFLVAFGAFASLAIPWRFVVVDEGIAMWFGFGKRRFLARDDVTVRVECGDVQVVPSSKHFGYLLTDGITNRRVPDLTAVLEEHGFDVLRS